MTGRPQKKAKPKTQRVRRWTAEEWSTFYRLWPVMGMGGAQKRYDQKQRDFLKGTKRIKRIGDPHAQIRLFCEWIGVPLNLWIHETWRDLIELRYRWELKPLIRLLDADWRRALDRSLTRAKTGDLPESGGSKQSRSLQLVATQYKIAKIWKELNRHHPLYRPITDPSFIALLQYEDPWLAEFQLDRYVTVPNGSHEFLIGAIIYTLHRFEDGFRGRQDQKLPELHGSKAWPLPIDRKTVLGNDDYKAISWRYRTHLELPVEPLSQIGLAHMRLKIHELAPRADPRSDTIRLAAALVEEYHPAIFNEYITRLRRMRREVLRPFIQSGGNPGNLDRLWRARFLPVLTALREDPLFSCVAFDVMNDIPTVHSGTRRPGRRSLKVEGQTAAYAVWKLQPYFPLKSGLTLADAVKDLKITTHHVRNVIPTGRQRGLYNVLAPLLSALFRYRRTASQIKEISRKYKNIKEMEEIDAWTSEIVEQTWTSVRIDKIRKRSKPH